MKNFKTKILSNQEISPGYYRMRILAPGFGALAHDALLRLMIVSTSGIAASVQLAFSAFLLGISMLLFLYNLVSSVFFKKIPAAANPWNSLSMEFQLPTPVPVHNFDRIPVFSSEPASANDARVPAGRCFHKGEKYVSAGARSPSPRSLAMSA